MRRKASLVLLAFAVFFAALAPLVRWYAFPRLAKIPPSEYQTAVLEARPATLLDYATMKPRTVSKVSIVQTLRGQRGRGREGRQGDRARRRRLGRPVVRRRAPTARWSPGSPSATSSTPTPRTRCTRAASTSTATPCAARASSTSGPSSPRSATTSYFDAQTRTSAPIHYKGTRNFRGLTVYYFEQTIPWTKVPLPKTMPVDGVTPETVRKAGTSRWYTTKRMFWVEPTTGAPVNGQEIHREELRGGTLLGGRDRVTVFSGHVKMREDYIAHTVKMVSSQRQLVLAFTTYLPWGFGALGAGLLAVALLLEARSRRPGAPSPGPRRRLVNLRPRVPS